MAAGVSPGGMDFNAVDDKDVHLVFLVMAELHNPGPNVEVLADIGYLVQVPGAYDRLVSARTASEFIRTMEEVQNEPGASAGA